jgi:hypothetical protein
MSLANKIKSRRSKLNGGIPRSDVGEARQRHITAGAILEIGELALFRRVVSQRNIGQSGVMLQPRFRASILFFQWG